MSGTSTSCATDRSRDFLKCRLFAPCVKTPTAAVWFGIWFGMEGKLARFKDGRFTRFDEADGILKSIVYSITSDREGLIWVATSRGGVSRAQTLDACLFD